MKKSELAKNLLKYLSEKNSKAYKKQKNYVPQTI